MGSHRADRPTPLDSPLTASDDGWVNAVAFAPDGDILATAGTDGTVRLWDLTEPTAPTPLGSPLTAAEDSWIPSVDFAPDGTVLVSAGLDGTVRLWNTSDPAAPTPLGTPLTGYDGGVWSVAFAPDASIMASAGGLDGTVRLWNLTGLMKLRDHAMERACTITGGGLTRAEWDRYVEGLLYVDVCKT